MRQIIFFKNNKEKWKKYEGELHEEKKIAPAELTEMFIDITEDLGYARTHYPKSDLEEYVNQLAARTHQAIYRNKRYGGNILRRFFLKKIPDIIYTHKNFLLYSFIAFSLSTLLGFISQMYYPDYVRLILGDFYVDSTIQRIREGDPLGVYKESEPWLMFVMIAMNNIRVSFLVFVAGIMTAFGTYYLLGFNGIMLGSFFAMFYQYNVINEALKVVWIHGTIEILSIVVAGSAGLIMGNSFLFPGSYPRLYAFQMKSRDALSIIWSLIPFFVVAAFLESFVTRYTTMPLWLSLFIIMISFILMAGYFVLFPFYRNIAIKNKSL